MKKYKVKLQLMVDPSKGDETFNKTYKVYAEDESKAFDEASKAQSNDEEDIRYRSIFNYSVKEITDPNLITIIERCPITGTDCHLMCCGNCKAM